MEETPVWVRYEINSTAGTKFAWRCICCKCQEGTAPVHYRSYTDNDENIRVIEEFIPIALETWPTS